MLPYQHRGVLDFVRIHARLDWFFHSITIEMLDTKQPKFTETSTPERFLSLFGFEFCLPDVVR